MSRTDKTQPYRVKLWDGTLARVAVHDHRRAPCDLPETMRGDLAAVCHWRWRRCRWEFRYTGVRVCCCAMCTGGHWNREEHRADRHDTRRRLRDDAKAWRGGSLEPDA